MCIVSVSPAPETDTVLSAGRGKQNIRTRCEISDSLWLEQHEEPHAAVKTVTHQLPPSSQEPKNQANHENLNGLVMNGILKRKTTVTVC